MRASVSSSIYINIVLLVKFLGLRGGKKKLV